MRKDFILEVSEGTPKPYTEPGAHLSKANILLVLVMNFGPVCPEVTTNFKDAQFSGRAFSMPLIGGLLWLEHYPSPVTSLVPHPQHPLSTMLLSDWGPRGAARAWKQHLVELKMWTMKYLKNSMSEERGGAGLSRAMQHESCPVDPCWSFSTGSPTVIFQAPVKSH